MHDLITVRPGTLDDLAALDALFARSYPKLLRAHYPPSTLVTAVPMIAKAQPRLLATGTYYVVAAGDSLLAAGGWTHSRQKGVANIRHVVTDDRHVRKGLGRALFSHIFHTAKAAGMTRLDCQSTRTAVPFYQAMGFTLLRKIEVPLGPGITFPALQMARTL